MHKSRKLALGILVCIAAVSITVLVTYRVLSPPSAECASMNAFDLAIPSLEAAVNESSEIVYGTYNFSSTFEGTVTAKDVIKGKTLKRNSVVSLCPHEFNPTELKSGSDVIVFFDGKDGALWSVTYPRNAVLPIKDGQVSIEEKSYSLDEVRKAIKEQE